MTKKVTLDQFRAWLEGVEEMQDEDWVPNLRQWQTIRAKIDAILDDEGPAQTSQPRQRMIPLPGHGQGQEPPRPAPPVSESALMPGGPQPEPVSSPAAKSILSGKTPDSESGNDSPFA